MLFWAKKVIVGWELIFLDTWNKIFKKQPVYIANFYLK